MSTFLANVANTVSYFILPRVALDTTGNLVWQLLNPEVVVNNFCISIFHLPYNIQGSILCLSKPRGHSFRLAYTFWDVQTRTAPVYDI